MRAEGGLVLRAITTVLLGILCLAASVPMLALALGERERTQLSCEVFDPDTVEESWLELRGCRLSWFEASYARVGQRLRYVRGQSGCCHWSHLRLGD